MEEISKAFTTICCETASFKGNCPSSCFLALILTPHNFWAYVDRNAFCTYKFICVRRLFLIVLDRFFSGRIRTCRLFLIFFDRLFRRSVRIRGLFYVFSPPDIFTLTARDAVCTKSALGTRRCSKQQTAPCKVSFRQPNVVTHQRLCCIRCNKGDKCDQTEDPDEEIGFLSRDSAKR